MSAKVRTNKKCNICNSDLICEHCGVPSKSGTPFSNWLRSTNIKASCHNIDFVWHNYIDNWFITIEEKRFMAIQSRAQVETQAIVFQMLRSASGRRCKTLHGWKEIEYRGHYLIVFENTSPENGKIFIDHDEVTKEDLISLLNTGKRASFSPQ